MYYIDPLKLYEQDEEFKQFVQECILPSLESSPEFNKTVISLYAMYQAGRGSD